MASAGKLYNPFITIDVYSQMDVPRDITGLTIIKGKWGEEKGI